MTGRTVSIRRGCDFVSPAGVSTVNGRVQPGTSAGSVTSATICVSPTFSGFLSGTAALPLLTILMVALAVGKLTAVAVSSRSPRMVTRVVLPGAAPRGMTTSTFGSAFLSGFFLSWPEEGRTTKDTKSTKKEERRIKKEARPPLFLSFLVLGPSFFIILLSSCSLCPLWFNLTRRAPARVRRGRGSRSAGLPDASASGADRRRRPRRLCRRHPPARPDAASRKRRGDRWRRSPDRHGRQRRRRG